MRSVTIHTPDESMPKLRERFSDLQKQVEAQSVTTSLAVLVGALVLFIIAQRLAQVSDTTLRTTPTVVFTSLLATALFVVSIASLALAAWRITIELRERELQLDVNLDRFR